MEIEICRICLTKNEEYIEIFGTEGVQRDIQSIVEKYFSFQIEEHDEFSKKICFDCWETIGNFHNFYLRINSLHQSLNWNDIPVDTQLIKSETDTQEFNDKIDYENLVIKPEIKSIAEIDDEEDSQSVQNDDSFSPDTGSDSVDSDEELEYSNTKRSTSRKQIKNENDVEGIEKPKRKRKRITKKQFNNSANVPDEQFHAENEQIRQLCKMDCDLCPEKFNEFADASRHYRKVHKTKGYLVCCDKKLLMRCRVLQHIRRHIEPDAFKCEHCNKTFLDKLFLSRHLENFHTTAKPTFVCDICSKVFYTAYRLQLHRLCHKDKVFTCKHCDKSFTSNGHLQGHIRMYHDGAYQHICDICAKIFKTKLTFAQHMKFVHGDLKKAQCEQCGAWTKNDTSLKRHMKLHEPLEKKFVCNICGKIAPNRGALRRHNEYMHVLERSHICDICKKSFRRSVELKEHMTTHTGEGYLYTCPYCPKTFNFAANMHSHKKKIHPIEWAESKKDKEYNC